ncbi:MAG: helix-turn-helix domain-containing protein [Oscillospiraceae bacterium]|nr:helix-turn-helix domain-containing protein [Oscillospiraceae bacterium]
MFNQIIFSQRLKELRIERNLKQETIGDVAGIKISAISMMEKGHRAPSIEVICAIADYFNVSVDYLVGRTDDPKLHKK